MDRMDSVFMDIHWESGHIALLADEWIGEKLPDELLVVPKEYDLSQDEDVVDSRRKSNEPIKWDYHPMDE